MILVFCSPTIYAQNVGIGMAVPTAKLHVNGPIKLEGLNLFEFGANVAGKEVNAGKIGYNAFGQNALTFIGAGTNASNRAVYFYAEGGTTFTGPVNVGGTIQLNGNPGNTGQVLTSNGSSDPTWQNAAYANDTRFGILFSKNTGNRVGDATIGLTLYNLNSTNVSIGASNITINKTGLYHFDISMRSDIHYSVIPSFYPKHELLFFFGLANSLRVINKEMEPTDNGNTNWSGQEKVTTDVYITAGSVIHFYHIIGNGPVGAINSYDVDGFVTGYLISE